MSVEGEQETASAFVRLSSLELTSFTLFESEAAGRRLGEKSLFVPAEDRRRRPTGSSPTAVRSGSGQTQGLLLQPKQDNALDFPIEIEHGSMLAAAGGALASGGEIDGRLQGTLSVRLPGGDIAVPLDLSGKVSLTQ